MSDPAISAPPSTSLEALTSARPHTGLFADKDWLFSPTPFAFENGFERKLERLGYQLLLFQRACNLLYFQSVKGKQPAWVAAYLDRGKPEDLIEFSQRKETRDDLPAVLRPDLILTRDGFAITELDNVPGGIGLTAWLSQTYADLGCKVLGGRDGMLDGFSSILPGGEIFVSPESETYRPEMQWLAEQLNTRTESTEWSVRDTDSFGSSSGRAYRFFELFDLPNLAAVPAMLDAVRNETLSVTPPFKPFLEEKLWFGLFWMRPLREFWRRQLGDRVFRDLQQVIPYTWIIDPTPLPHHGVIPGLEIQQWKELGTFSQKEREFVLKISGFSELAWGSRGVTIAQDVPQTEWQDTIRQALDGFESGPSILQIFRKGKQIEHPYFDHETGAVETMNGRVRLCPYYFVEDNKAVLRGVLATICPADKKIIHGMKDAILVPAG